MRKRNKTENEKDIEIGKKQEEIVVENKKGFENEKEVETEVKARGIVVDSEGDLVSESPEKDRKVEMIVEVILDCINENRNLPDKWEDPREGKTIVESESNRLRKDFEVDCDGIEILKIDVNDKINNLPDKDPRNDEPDRIEKLETFENYR